MPQETISIEEARRIALFAQGLSGKRLAGPDVLLDQLGAVQLDTISVLARSHVLVAWARLGPVPTASIEACYWSSDAPTAFEYWSHAACVLPLRRWPEFEARRRAARARGRRWHRLERPTRSLNLVRRQLATEGPLTATELGGANQGGPWWDWSEQKIAVEWLLDIGEVVCVERRGWRRVYDLTERAIPETLRSIELSDAECHRAMVAESARALGVASVGDLARHQKMSLRQVRSHLADLGLTPLRVGSEREPWYASASALQCLNEASSTRTTMLSPFDSLLWERPRVKSLFGLDHRLEAYVPKERRIAGYFAMPVLSGTNLVATVDPAREGATFVARHVVVLERTAIDKIATAVARAARWVGASDSRVERVTPLELQVSLRAAIASKFREAPSSP